MLNFISKLTRYLEKPVRFDLLNKWLAKPFITILDAGCGNHSSSKTKKYYPNCKYYGLDKCKNYNNSPEDFELMEKFYEIDLDCDLEKLNKIPNDFFDCVILSHILEHLENGEEVILRLLAKVKIGGAIYIETPTPRFSHLPKTRRGLNFCDDLDHKRIYLPNELETLLTDNGFSIIRSGIRRSLKRIIFFPLYLIVSLIKYKYVSGTVFWDILGYASYIISARTNENKK